MTDPFITRDRRADLLTDLASHSSAESPTADMGPLGPDTKKDVDKPKDIEKKDLKEVEKGEDSLAGYSALDDFIDAAEADEPIAQVIVGRRWVKPTDLSNQVPVV
jgi:hypothetical protein